MKRILLALAILALFLPAARPAKADVGISIDFFYDNLTTGGSWLEVDDYGYCWQPSVAVTDPTWRPYADGYWAWTDLGWTWVSYEDFGWATYHYGRWVRLRSRGWVWVPGRVWGPAWVSWRYGGDYVGWAPLPPTAGYSFDGEVVYQGRPISGYVDVEYDIGPAYYNFVNVRYIGEPVLRRRILPPTQNVTYIQTTVNVTNITYNNNVVHNYGPDIEAVNRYSARPIQRLKLERRSDVDYREAAEDGDLTRVQGNTLVVAAPTELRKPEEPVAPKEVKARIDNPEVERGWSDVEDERKKQALIEKMKKEDRKSIPPPQGETEPADGRTPPPGSLAASPDGTPVKETAPDQKDDEKSAQAAKEEQKTGEDGRAQATRDAAKEAREQAKEERKNLRREAQPAPAGEAAAAARPEQKIPDNVKTDAPEGRPLERPDVAEKAAEAKQKADKAARKIEENRPEPVEDKAAERNAARLEQAEKTRAAREAAEAQREKAAQEAQQQRAAQAAEAAEAKREKAAQAAEERRAKAAEAAEANRAKAEQAMEERRARAAEAAEANRAQTQQAAEERRARAAEAAAANREKAAQAAQERREQMQRRMEEAQPRIQAPAPEAPRQMQQAPVRPDRQISVPQMAPPAPQEKAEPRGKKERKGEDEPDDGRGRE